MEDERDNRVTSGWKNLEQGIHSDESKVIWWVVKAGSTSSIQECVDKCETT